MLQFFAYKRRSIQSYDVSAIMILLFAGVLLHLPTGVVGMFPCNRWWGYEIQVLIISQNNLQVPKPKSKNVSKCMNAMRKRASANVCCIKLSLCIFLNRQLFFAQLPSSGIGPKDACIQLLDHWNHSYFLTLPDFPKIQSRQVHLQFHFCKRKVYFKVDLTGHPMDDYVSLSCSCIPRFSELKLHRLQAIKVVVRKGCMFTGFAFKQDGNQWQEVWTFWIL